MLKAVQYNYNINTIYNLTQIYSTHKTTEQLRVGVQQQLTALSVQINVNISLDEVDRFGMSISLT